MLQSSHLSASAFLRENIIISRKAAKTQSINQPQYLKEKKYHYGFKAYVPVLYGSHAAMPDVPALLQASELERLCPGCPKAEAGGR